MKIFPSLILSLKRIPIFLWLLSQMATLDFEKNMFSRNVLCIGVQNLFSKVDWVSQFFKLDSILVLLKVLKNDTFICFTQIIENNMIMIKQLLFYWNHFCGFWSSPSKIFLFIIRSCLIWLKLGRTSCWTSLSNLALHFLPLIPLSPVFLPWLRLHPDKVILWKLIFFNFNIVSSIRLFIYTCNCFQELKDWLDIWLCTTSLWL